MMVEEKPLRSELDLNLIPTTVVIDDGNLWYCFSVVNLWFDASGKTNGKEDPYEGAN